MPPATQIRLRGVPHVFTSYDHVLSFLRSSPGYVSRQRGYLETYWSGALRQAGYKPPKVAPLPKVQNLARNDYELQKHGFVGASQRSNARASYQRQKDVAASTTYTQNRLARAHAVQQARIAPTPVPHIGFSAAGGLAGGVKALGEVGQAVEGLPGGIKLAVTHPERFAKGTVRSFEETVQHPLRHPGFTALNLLALGSLGAGSLARAGAVSRAATVGEAARAAIRPLPATPRELTVDGVTVQRFPSRNPLTSRVLRQRDVSLQRQLDQPGAFPATSPRNITSADAAFGRELSRQYGMRIAQAQAPAKAFSRFAHGPEKLTAAEEKAFETIARGHAPETMLQHHVNGAEARAALGDTAGAEAHARGAVLTKASADLVRNPTPKLARAVDEARTLIHQRESDLGMTADEAAHSIGKAHDEIAALAESRPSLSQRLADEKPDSPEAKAIHDQLVATGKQAQENGAFYLKTARSEPLRAGPPATFRSPGPSGMGPPAITREKAYTGGAQRGGKYRTDVARLIATSSNQATKIRMARDYAWPTVLKLAKDSPEEAGGAKYAIPVRTTKKIPDQLREIIQKANPDHAEQLDELHASQLESLHKYIFPDRIAADAKSNTVADAFTKPGAKDAIKWVDARKVSGLLSKGGPGFVRYGGTTKSLGEFFDWANAVPRAATLYAKPSYYWNRVQQALQNASQQGLFLPANGRLLKRVLAENPVQDYYTIKSLVGTGRSRAIAPEGGPLKEKLGRAADRWSRITDDKSRELSFVHEARREGFDTPEKIHALLTDPAHQPALDRVVIRANHEAIPFGKMSDLERRTIARAMFFYPWTRAAIEWTLRFPGEHPVQAATGVQIGRQGQNQRMLPEWAKGLAFWTGGKTPLTSDFSNLNTPQTAVDVGQILGNLGKPPTQQAGQTLAGELGPIPAAGYGLLTGTVRGHGNLSPLTGAARGVIDSTPFSTFQRRLAGSKTYPGGIVPAVGSYLGGAEAPRPTSADALAKAGEKERRAQLDPVQKAVDDGNWNRQQLLAGARESGRIGPTETLPKQLREATVSRTKRYANIARAKIPHGTGHYQQDAFKVDVQTLLNMKKISPEAAHTALTWASEQTEDKLKAERHRIGDKYFGGAALSDAKAKINQGHQRNAFEQDVRALAKRGDIDTAKLTTALEWAKDASASDVEAERVRVEKKYGLPAQTVKTFSYR